jgi:hypothetical protein
VPTLLTRFQRLMLRAWAINITLAWRPLRWLGFDYSSDEEARLRALAAPLSAAALTVWVLLSVALFLLVGIPILIFALTQLEALPAVVMLGLIIVTAFSILPLAMGTAAGVVELLFRIPPFEESARDTELFGKVRGQLLLVEIAAVVGAVIIYYAPGTGG